MRRILAMFCALLSAACDTARDTLPERSATEQLLISAAAERAAEAMTFRFPPESKVFVDASNFEGYDAKYAIAAIRDRVLRRGGRLVADRAAADVIVEPRAGALSIDEDSTLVGIPSVELPIPLAGPMKTPELALFKKHRYQGVAKLASTVHDAKTGMLIQSLAPAFATSHKTLWDVIFVSWTTDDLKEIRPRRPIWFVP